MQVSTVGKISNIEKDIRRIYLNNSSMTPYQSYDFLSITGKGMVDKQPLLVLGMHEINYVVRNDMNEIILIAPMIYCKKQGINHIYFRGQWTSAAHLDFLFREEDYSYEAFSKLMDYIQKNLVQCIIHLSKIPECSRTNTFLRLKFMGRYRYAQEECATIILPDTYDEWIHSLKKNPKQNIRTAYNRLAKEGKRLEYNFGENEIAPQNVFDEMLNLYARRLSQKNSHNKTLQKFLFPTLRAMKKRNPMTRALRIMPNSCYGVLRIDGEVAACFWALSCNDGRIIVPRLSINDRFGVYCPGGLIIAETIKWLTQNSITPENRYSEFDLSCGNEPYKYAYGATLHKNINYYIDPQITIERAETVDEYPNN